MLRAASETVFVPMTVGGGIREFTDAQGKAYTSLDVAAEYFRSGADKARAPTIQPVSTRPTANCQMATNF